MSIASLHNESLLVTEMQTGSEEAFARLYRHYSPYLYINILRMVRDPATTEEMVQELFTRVWQKRENRGIKENFAGYIYTIGQNLVHDHFRRLKRDRQMMAKFKQLAEENYEHIEETLQFRQTSALLNQAIEGLSPQQKKVYELVKMEGCSYKQAAEVMGISPLTVKEYLVAGNKFIRNYILNHSDNNLVLLILLFGMAIFP